MNIPKKVKVGAITYKVSIVDEIKNKNDVLGHTSWHRQEIEIIKGKPEHMINTFLHEIIHTFNVISNEDQISNLGDRIHAFIKDNPRVFK